MCGRFARYRAIEQLIDEIKGFLPDLDAGEYKVSRPVFNAAPSQMVLTIGKSKPENPHKMALLKWGFVPFFAKDLKGHIPINAKSETVATSGMFRRAFNKQRCLVLMDGFFEWKKVEEKKIPYYFCIKGNKPHAFAGIYDSCTIDGYFMVTCAIITTEANELVTPTHDRMPVILRPEDFALWCDPEKSGSEVAHLLKPFPSDEMECRRASDRVNSPRNDDESLLAPVINEP